MQGPERVAFHAAIGYAGLLEELDRFGPDSEYTKLRMNLEGEPGCLSPPQCTLINTPCGHAGRGTGNGSQFRRERATAFPQPFLP